MGDLQLQLQQVRGRIDAAAQRSGVNSEKITLVAVSKTRSIEEMRLALQCGVTDFGENYAVEAAQKFNDLQRVVKWHFIGHLQRNKVKQVVGFADLIHSVNSLRLALEIGKQSVDAGKVTDVLLEINVTGEVAKTGTPIEEIQSLITAASEIAGIRVCGIMGMAHMTLDPEETRPYFRKLKKIFDTLPKEQRIYLSMGMTQDFEIAIEEGSNMVRIGTAIFGSRT